MNKSTTPNKIVSKKVEVIEDEIGQDSAEFVGKIHGLLGSIEIE